MSERREGGRGWLPLQPPGCFKHSVSLGEKVKYVGVQRGRPGTPAAIATVRACRHPSLHVAGPQRPRLKDVHQRQGLVCRFKAEGSYCQSTRGCVNMGGASGCLSGCLGEAHRRSRWAPPAGGPELWECGPECGPWACGKLRPRGV